MRKNNGLPGLVNACIIASEHSGVELCILRDVSRIAKLRAHIGITRIYKHYGMATTSRQANRYSI